MLEWRNKVELIRQKSVVIGYDRQCGVEVEQWQSGCVVLED